MDNRSLPGSPLSTQLRQLGNIDSIKSEFVPQVKNFGDHKYCLGISYRVFDQRCIYQRLQPVGTSGIYRH